MFTPSARVTLAVKFAAVSLEETVIDCDDPLNIRVVVAEVTLPLIVPVTVADAVLVSVPSAGELMVTPGLFGSTSTVMVPDTPVLPLPSTARTKMVLLPLFNSTPWLKLPPVSVIAVGVPPFIITVVVADVSLTLPDMVRFLLASMRPSVGLVTVITGATESDSTMRVVLSLLLPKVALITVVPAATVVTRPVPESIVATPPVELVQLAVVVLSDVDPSELMPVAVN